ncbi:MAG: transcriptional repressor [Mogibacterium sp.]|nr:transcriptional repressor [Mogibacterium sp.]
MSEKRKANYHTRQRDELTECLRSMAGGHITVNDVYRRLAEQGSRTGMTTVYRQLEKLVDEGLVNKYTIDASSPACFEYVGADAHAGQACFHCKCDKCGKLIHLHCHDLETIQAHLLAEHGFQMNPFRTVFYGLCEECRQA